jgi:hypothetical protein
MREVSTALCRSLMCRSQASHPEKAGGSWSRAACHCAIVYRSVSDCLNSLERANPSIDSQLTLSKAILNIYD